MKKQAEKNKRPNVEYVYIRRKKRNITFRALFSDQLRNWAVKDYLAVTTPIISPEMGQRFRKARVEMKLTQEELANRFGTSQVVISRIESGLIIHSALTSLQFRDVFKNRFEEVVSGGRFIRDHDLTYRYNKQIKRWVGEIKK